MMRLLRLDNQKGFVLLTTYMVVAAISVFSSALFARLSAGTSALTNSELRVAAHQMAESGLDIAIMQLKANGSYSGTGGYVASDSVYSSGGYDISVSTPTGEPGIRVVTVTGYSPDATSAGAISKAIQMNVEVQSFSVDNFVIVATEGVSLEDTSRIMSYDSTVTTTPTTNLTNDFHVVLSGADALTGGYTSALELTGTAHHYGGVRRSSGSVGVSVGGSASLDGTTSTYNGVLSTDPEETTEVSGGDLTIVDGETRYLTTGTYHYDDFVMEDNSEINVTGDVTVYLSGTTFTVGDNVLINSNSKDPSRLRIVTTEDASGVMMIGDAAVYATIRAYELSSIDLDDGSEFYGLIESTRLNMSGDAVFWYDTSLDGTSTIQSSNAISYLSWLNT